MGGFLLGVPRCVALVALSLCIAGCGRDEAPGDAPGDGAASSAPGPVRVVVTIPPLKGLVEPLLPRPGSGEGRGNAGGTVEVLIPAGVSEHGYEIPPSKLAALAKADVVVYIGLGLEPQVVKFLAQNPRPGRREVCFAEVAGAQDAGAAGSGSEHHDHGGEDHDHGHDHAGGSDHHAHGGQDPHLWLDPVMAARLIPAVAEAITDVMAAAGTIDETVRHGLVGAAEAQTERIRGVDEAYRAAFEGVEQRTIVVAHDAYGWLARRYGLRTVAVSGLTAGEPTPGAIERAVAAVREAGLPVVFVEPQLSPAAGRRIAEATGAEVLVLDPVGDGDWFSMMEKNLAALRRALTPGAAGVGDGG